MKKFIISTAALKKVLHKLSYAINPKSTLPILNNIWCKVSGGSVEFIATDLEATILYRQPCEYAGEAFEFLLPFQLVQKIVSLSKECPLSFSLEKKGIKITGENDVYEVKNAYKLEDFPKIPAIPKKVVMDMDNSVLGWLNVALKTVGNDDSEKKVRLTKVLLELRSNQITVASTDGSFMLFSYTMNLPAPADEDILVGPKIIKALEGLKDTKVSWTDKIYAFHSEEVTVIVTRPEMKYVSFRTIIPQDFDSNLPMSRADLIEALEKCNINSDPFKETKLLLKNKEKVSFIAKDTQFGININVDVEGKYTGPLDSIMFNSEKMLKLMHQVSFDTIEIAAHDDKRAILFRSPDDTGYLGLLMPMNVKKSEE